ncbi:hypothetical protein GGTG_07236 [Gaeumannomyces tritici R3-111a-1]|uniref:UbiA prenyltransferase n=1 Tax=Gaeumannomyces tritici (strain R3-111a-1) TaxID=644352 RepID=J3P139_GAET3|nr:hypothetical protein GGTG_07236 [Gaeumannomyces tritici R3-111a-1]EJT77324.1 hypothetical protein GGTG_07236 [Gaeumannomyces tritici R3-111a-1]
MAEHAGAKPEPPHPDLSHGNPPAAGVFLIYIPRLFDLHGAISQHHEHGLPPDACAAARAAAVLLGGSLFYSNATHTWNDLVDRQIARTRNRPGWPSTPWPSGTRNLAQVVLGLTVSWAVVVGAAAAGAAGAPWRDPSALWVMVYDTAYARLDLAGDRVIRVKSMAVLLAGHTRAQLWALVGCMAVTLAAVGRLGGWGGWGRLTGW